MAKPPLCRRRKLFCCMIVAIVIATMAACLALCTGCSHDTSHDVTSGSSRQTAITYTFRTEKLYDQHFEKHGAEFGDITQEEYLEGANALIAGTDVLTKTEDDGDKLFYRKATNEFGVLSRDGYIRTYFKPARGLKYWEDQ